MPKRQPPMFEWDEESGLALCILSDGNNTFVGTAQCAEEDSDMKGEKTGCTIALHRAQIAYYKHIRDNELKPALEALHQLYYSMKHSKRFNEKSYENKMLQRQLQLKQFDLDTINKLLATERTLLKDYLEDKDNTFKRVRENRAKLNTAGN